jgi:zinc transporter 1
VQIPTGKAHHSDLGINAIAIHILGDILNNVGVIAAALIMMLAESHGRFYADPAISMVIAIMITAGALPLSISFLVPSGSDLRMLT